MQQKEFEQLTGVQVTEEEYEWIEEMYMRTGSMEKQEFCAEWQRHGRSPLVEALMKDGGAKEHSIMELRVENAALRARLREAETREYLSDKTATDMVMRPEEASEETVRRLKGDAWYARTLLELGYDLDREQREMIVELLKDR